MEVSNEVINEIADNLELNLECYFHPGTLQVVAFPDPDQLIDMDDDHAWKKDIELVKNNKKFIQIEKMNSSDSFKVMQEFVDVLENSTTKIRLLVALEGKKPFANFKSQIDNADDYREKWFAFRKQKNIEWVQHQIHVLSNK